MTGFLARCLPECSPLAAAWRCVVSDTRPPMSTATRGAVPRFAGTLAVSTFHGGPPPCEQVNPRSRWRPDQRAGPWQGPKAQGVGYKNKSGGRGRVAATFCGGQRPPERQRGRCRVPLVEQKGVLCDAPGGACEPSSANERIKPLLFQPQNIRRMQCGLQGRLRRRMPAATSTEAA